MSQYKTGRVILLQNGSVVYGNHLTDWSGIDIGDGPYFVPKGWNALIPIAEVALRATPSEAPLHSLSSSYVVGDIVKDSSGVEFMCRTGGATGHATTDAYYWMRMSGYCLVLGSSWEQPSSLLEAEYGIITDFTPEFGLPLPSPGDHEVAAVVSRALIQLDSLIGTSASDASSANNQASLVANSALTIISDDGDYLTVEYKIEVP